MSPKVRLSVMVPPEVKEHFKALIQHNKTGPDTTMEWIIERIWSDLYSGNDPRLAEHFKPEPDYSADNCLINIL